MECNGGISHNQSIILGMLGTIRIYLVVGKVSSSQNRQQLATMVEIKL